MTNRVTSSNPAYRAAYHLTKANPKIKFALAYALAQLVLDEGGGPLPTGKRFPIKQARALQKFDLVEIHTNYEDAFTLQKSYALRDEELVPHYIPGALVSSGGGTRLVTATPEAIQLIHEYANRSQEQ